MIKDFIKNSAIYAIGKTTAIIVGLCTIPIITKQLSPEQFGIFDILNLCLILLNLSVAMEISQAVARFIADTKNKSERQNYVTTAFVFTFVMFTVFAVAIYLCRDFLSLWIFKTTEYAHLFYYLIAWLYLHGSNSFILNQLRWENMPKAQISLQILLSLSLLSSVFIFMIILPPSIEKLTQAYIVSNFITMVIGFSIIFRTGLMNLSFSFEKLKYMLIFSIPLVPSSISVFAQSYIDRIMISRMLDFSELGLYSLAFRIAAFTSVFAGIFQLAIVPLIYKNYKNKNAQQDIGAIAQIYALCMFILILTLNLFMPDLFALFINSTYIHALAIIPIILFSIGIQSFSVFAPGLGIEKKSHYIAMINVIGMSINVILNFILIQKLGTQGAAIATLTSATLMCVVHFVVSNRFYPVNINYTRIFLGLSFCVMLAPLSYTLDISLSIERILVKLVVLFFSVGALTFILIPMAKLQNAYGNVIKKIGAE